MIARLGSCLAVLAAALFIRLLSLPLYPLMDTTESRYGNMARMMAESGNWLTPMFDYGVPFWGKPPLHTWASAAGIELFGVNEFAVRLPHLIAGLLVLWLTVVLAKRLQLGATTVAMVLATTVVFIVAAGSVMTDMLLTVGMTLAMVGFYLGWHGQRYWSYLGFVGIAIGLLAKGPVIVVLVGLTLLPWLLWQFGPINGFKQLWQRIPLLTGLALCLLIAAPWYLLAEQATPGFLEYFLVGEHYLRFVDAGWEGDLYGSAHDQPRGMIWLYFLVAALPWTPVLLVLAIRQWRQGQRRCSSEVALLLCWLLAPLWLFTFAGNILPAYVLPGIPALALLIGCGVHNGDKAWLGWVGGSTPVLLLVAILLLHFATGDDRSDKRLVAQTEQLMPMYYWEKGSFSGQFYRDGKVEVIDDIEQLQTANEPFYLVLRKHQYDLLPEWAQQRCERQSENKKRLRLGCQPDRHDD